MTDPFDAAVSEAEDARFVEAFGKQYEVRRKVASMAMLKFAKLASRGMQTSDMEAGAAMYDVLRAVFTKDAWAQFEDDAIEEGADNDELFAVVKDAVALIHGFPTTPSSASSAGPSSTTPNSTVSSFAERKKSMGMVPVSPESLRELVG